jgi:phage terminase large subunit-like protein
VQALGEKYNIAEIAYDPWNATQLAGQLETDGFKMIPITQTMANLCGATKQTLTMVKKRQLHHGGNPVLRWTASNVAVKEDPSGNQRPDKEKSTEKIDPMVALIMAIGRAMVNPETSSVYETRGVITI